MAFRRRQGYGGLATDYGIRPALHSFSEVERSIKLPVGRSLPSR
jgi:hypothetical protein